MQLIKPSQFERRAVPGELFIRVDLNTISLSKQLCEDMKLEKGNFLGFTQEGENIFLSQVKTEQDGFTLRGVAEKGLQFSFAAFVNFLLKHYGLLDLLKNSGEFKCHRFPLVKIERNGVAYYMLEPPRKLQTATPNGRKEASVPV
jgi:hypothetical protein